MAVLHLFILLSIFHTSVHQRKMKVLTEITIDKQRNWEKIVYYCFIQMFIAANFRLLYCSDLSLTLSVMNLLYFSLLFFLLIRSFF